MSKSERATQNIHERLVEPGNPPETTIEGNNSRKPG